MKRSGFTLIEIMIVVGIIAIILTTSVMSVASGRGAVKVKEATRGVMQLSRYASALALLRQRPVVVTYHKSGKIEVRISGEASGSGAPGTPSDPIYREVNGETTLTAAEIAAEDDPDGVETAGGKESTGKEKTSQARQAEKKGFFYTRQVLDPETLRKEDAEGEYEGVSFTIEVLGEDGEVLDPELASMRTLRQPPRKKESSDDDPEEDAETDAEEPVSVTYEPNGSVNPYRVIVRPAGDDESGEGFAIEISRSGKASVGDDEDDGRGRRKRNARKRR